ncbi:hypothetical protein [Promicromonospora iranensis]|uniref:Uncharacterized protein n=1 Tax=Promicromonospora iranensis TaxID=1105144 RepID=A0ABU2CRB0_9MICO|nr:hypothetical protein [Promicromonospora iranensis]MDR7383879.1 hypothetical protein [Promicromonospora iranensis]
MSNDLLTTLCDASPTIGQDDPALGRAHAIMAGRRRAVTPRPRRRRVGRIPLVVAAAAVAVAAPLTATNLVRDADELPTGFVQAHENVAYGWLPPGTATATLIGYDDEGAATRIRELPPQNPPW